MTNNDSFGLLASNILRWSRNAFLTEIRTGFIRAKIFDGVLSRQRLSLLTQRSISDLQILARILPLQIWTEGSLLDTTKFSIEEQEVFTELLADTAQVQASHSAILLERIAKWRTKEARLEFRKARKLGERELKTIALKLGYQFVSAGSGEWGLQRKRDWGILTVSFHLQNEMLLTYSVNLTNESGHSLRFHDNYLWLLGISASQWDVHSSKEIAEKLWKVCEFTEWHVEEYERIISQQ